MRKQIVIFLLASSLFLTSCFTEKQDEKISKINKYYDIEKVATGSISLNESYISYAKWIKEVPLSTKVPWRITYLSKNVWDKVKSGEFIAGVSTQEATNGEKTANSIINSLETLKASTALSFDEQIKSVETKINQIKIWAELSGIWISWSESGIKSTSKIVKKQLDTLWWQINQAQTGVKQAQ